MPDETILSAARRVVRFIRIDDERDGGLLSRQTLQANEVLAQKVVEAERQEKLRHQQTNDHQD